MRLVLLYLLTTLFLQTLSAQDIPEGRKKEKKEKKESKGKNADDRENKDSFKAEEKGIPGHGERGGQKRSPDEEDRRERAEGEPASKRARGDEATAPDIRSAEGPAHKLNEADIRHIAEAKTMHRMDEVLKALESKGKITGNSRMGYAATSVETTEKKDFSGMRDIQVMRYIITQLYFMSGSLDAKNKLPVEFQLMRFENKAGDVKFFIASNDRRSLNNIASIMQLHPEQMEEYLLSDYSELSGDKAAEAMLNRFQEKLTRLLTTEISEENEFRSAQDLVKSFLAGITEEGIGKLDLVRKDTKQLLEDPLRNLIESPDQSVFLLYGKNDLHAEMKFIQLIEMMEKSDPEALQDCKIQIIGTRRPCAGCKGRLQLCADEHHLHDDDPQITFIEEHGRVWTKSLLQLVLSEKDETQLEPLVSQLFELTYKSAEQGFRFNEDSIDEDKMDLDEEEKKEVEDPDLSYLWLIKSISSPEVCLFCSFLIARA